nr:hypothetical protein [Serratia odorifera]
MYVSYMKGRQQRHICRLTRKAAAMKC